MKFLRVSLSAALIMVPMVALAGQRPRVQVQCKSTDDNLVYHCIFKVTGKKSHEPIEGAAFKVNADMPTMPMAHNVRAIKPEPIKGKPGVYQGTLQLEMRGEWALKMTFKKPVRDIVVQKLMFGDSSIGEVHSDHSSEIRKNAGEGEGAVDRKSK